MTGLPLPDLEAVYDELAQAIDAVGEAKSALMLTKLALLLAQALGDGAAVRRAIAAAQQDL